MISLAILVVVPEQAAASIVHQVVLGEEREASHPLAHPLALRLAAQSRPSHRVDQCRVCRDSGRLLYHCE